MLIVATLTLMTPRTFTGLQEGASLSVLSTQIEVVADYTADARERRSAARATSVPEGHSETAGAFDRLDETADRGTGKKYKVSIVVRNGGPGDIRAVTLEYPLGYPHGRRPPERLRFKARREIKQGETLTLSHNFVTAKHVVLRSGGQAVIESIEYKDGSVWRR
jgi:hypothetical protein